MQEVKKYLITRENIFGNDCMPVIDLPLHKELIYVEVKGDKVLLYLQHHQNAELFKTQIYFHNETGVLPEFIDEKRMHHNFSIHYNDQLFHVYI